MKPFNNPLTTFGEVVNHLEDASRHCHDEKVPVQDIVFEDLDTVRIGLEKHPLRSTAARAISSRLGIPFPYLQRCPADVQAFNLNHWLKAEKNEELFFRFDGREVRAVFTPRYVPVDHLTIARELEGFGILETTKVQARIDEGFMFLSIPDTRGGFSVNGRDRMLPGISIGNSEVGLASLSISAFILRLVCTNGLISREKTVISSYRHISTKVLDNLPRLVTQASDSALRQQQRLSFSLESPVQDPVDTLNRFNRQFQLSEEEQEAVNWALPFEAGQTLFHIIQTYTRASQHPALSADAAYKIQRVAGEILELVSHGNRRAA